jgi:hypothetical protein
MQVEVLEILLDSHITDQKAVTKIPFSERWRRRQQNEKVTLWNNPFSVGLDVRIDECGVHDNSVA